MQPLVSMMYLKGLGPALLGTLLFAGCEVASDAAPAAPFRPTAVLMAKPTDVAAELEPDQAYRQFEARARQGSELRYYLAQTDDWREADAIVQSILARHRDVPAAYGEQTAAVLMLQAHLVPGEEHSPDRVAAIGRYTEMLLRHQSPSAMLIDQALDALEGYWSSERIAAAARRTYAIAESYVERQAGCEGCGLTKARRKIATSQGATGARVSALVQQTATGAERLSARL